MSEELKESYKAILSTLDSTAFNLDEDQYSGVFLPVAFDKYEQAPTKKVMLVGQQTESWRPGYPNYQDYGKRDKDDENMRRILHAVEHNDLDSIIEASVCRYTSCEDTPWAPGKKYGFQGYHNELAEALNLDPKGVIWANLLAWDYAGKSVFKKDRPKSELDEIYRISKELLAAQIQAFEPRHIVFSSLSHDRMIEDLFNEYWGGCETDKEMSQNKGFWIFSAADAISTAGATTCFRVAHPRVRQYPNKFKEHIQHLKDLISLIKKSIDRS